MTVLERLLEQGSAEEEARAAAARIAALLPVGRSVVVDDDVLEAARAGDIVALQSLLAEEVEPEPNEVALLEELRAGPASDRETIPLQQVKVELGP
ncbi:MAG: hypothetical protein ACLPYS_02315 [Vulcanimicrobiaceae bacterium]